MLDSKRGLLPFRHGIHLSKSMSPKTPEEIEQMAKVPYISAIESLMYAILCIRPDIAYAISVTSRFQSNPGLEYWIAVKSIFKYLRRTKHLILTYGGSDFANRWLHKIWFVFIYNRGVVSWKSSKKSITVDSTTKVEYIAAADAVKEAV